MEAVIKEVVTTQKLFACPECGSLEHSCDHLKAGQSFGPWYCDKCGCSILGTVTESGADIRIHKDRKANSLVLLRLNVPGTEDKPVHIVVKGFAFHKKGETPEFDGDGTRYFYDEGTCPWNYLRLPIKEGDDIDPHGLFVFEDAVAMPDGYEDSLDGIEQWRELFPTLRKDGE